MKDKRSNEVKEVVQRYCPYLEENVVMMVNYGAESKRFECVETSRCLHLRHLGCACAGENCENL